MRQDVYHSREGGFLVRTRLGDVRLVEEAALAGIESLGITKLLRLGPVVAGKGRRNTRVGTGKTVIQGCSQSPAYEDPGDKVWNVISKKPGVGTKPVYSGRIYKNRRIDLHAGTSSSSAGSR